MKPVGYNYLRKKLLKKDHKISRFRVETQIIEKGRDLIEIKEGREIRHLRDTRKQPADDWEHLIFGLAHEGIHIPLLVPFFKEQGVQNTQKFVTTNQSGKYQRIIWFLFEELMDEKLKIDDTQCGRYTEILNSEQFFTGSPNKIKRYKIIDNRIGHNSLMPLIRKGELIKDSQSIKDSANLLIEQYSPELVQKSVNFLYAKETKKSNEIEKEDPDKKREAKFIDLLKRANQVEQLDEKIFIELQNAIVDPRYAAKSYRDFQTYIGATDLFGNETVHYICPKGEDNHYLMKRYEELSKDIMADETIDPIIAATIISFLFVYLHPIEDGNGRIHRFLIHYVLSKKSVTPAGMIFPVSAVIANNMNKYDKVLEIFSKEIVPVINYNLDEHGEMTVLDKETKHLYYGIDLTNAYTFLFWAIEETLEKDFKEELQYMKLFLYAKEEIRKVVDIPDRKLNSLINIILANQGKLSQGKRNSLFAELTDDEISRIEAIISSNS